MAKRTPDARRTLRAIYALEKRIVSALDHLPDCFLDIDPGTAERLCSLEATLLTPVVELESISDAEGKRFERSGVADKRTRAEQRRAIREYIALALATAAA